MESCKLLPCTCRHDYQDAQYGKGLRVHNPMKNGKTYVCTVCSSKKEA